MKVCYVLGGLRLVRVGKPPGEGGGVGTELDKFVKNRLPKPSSCFRPISSNNLSIYHNIFLNQLSAVIFQGFFGFGGEVDGCFFTLE